MMIFGIFRRRRRTTVRPPVAHDPRFYETGTRLVCPTCRRVLFRLTKPHRWGDIVQVDAVERVENVSPAVYGSQTECPDHGTVWPLVLPPIEAAA